MTDKQKVSNEKPICWLQPAATLPEYHGLRVCPEGQGFPVWAHPNGMYAPVSADPEGACKEEAYSRMDRFLRLNLDDEDYEEYSKYLDDVYTAPVAAQAQPDAIRHEHDWVQGPYVTDTVGSGWCVRIDGTDIFADLNQYGCKGRVTFQIARGLASKEEAETALDEWLSKYVTAQQPVSDADGLPPLPSAYNERGAYIGYGRSDLISYARAALAQQEPRTDADRAASLIVEKLAEIIPLKDALKATASGKAMIEYFKSVLAQQDDRSDWCRLSGCSHKAAGSPVWNNKQDAEKVDAEIDRAFNAVRKKLVALPRYSFLADGSGGVRCVKDSTGAWIPFDKAHALFDPVSVDAARKEQE